MRASVSVLAKNLLTVEIERWGGAMPGRKDYSGQRFGRLVAVSFVGRKHHNAVWLFRCDVVQSTGHQFRMLLAKTAPFVRVDVCIVRLPAPGQQPPSKSRCRIAPRRALSSVGVHHIERRGGRHNLAGRKRPARLKQPSYATRGLREG